MDPTSRNKTGSHEVGGAPTPTMRALHPRGPPVAPPTYSFLLYIPTDMNTDDATNMVVHDTLSHVNGVKMKDICVPNYFQSSEDDEEVQALVDVMCMHANVLHKMGVSQANIHSVARDQMRILSGFDMHATMQEIKVNKRAMENTLGCYSLFVPGGEIHSVHANKNYGYLMGDIILGVKGGIKE